MRQRQPEATDALASGHVSAHEHPHQLAVCERRLWCAVIQQAFVDAGMITPPRWWDRGRRSKQSREYHSAVHWLLHDRYDFIRVCMLAGVSASLVREAARELV